MLSDVEAPPPAAPEVTSPPPAPEVTQPETEHTPETYLTRSWNGENVLHIYPRTFKEARPDGEAHSGIGSIRGITEKLDWMSHTGVTAIWLGPIYESPGLDAGYDISDYRRVNPDLGAMEDVEELIQKAHEHDIRVIFDLVPNHTSDQSEWFKASSDPNHPDHETYKDYYIWRDAVEGELPKNIVDDEGRLEGLPAGKTVPNNWSSIFSLSQIDKARQQHGGEIPPGVDIPAVTAWVWNEARQQFYLAEFMKGQPSLNWNKQNVRDEIKGVVRFWLDKGVDGFRVDVVNHIGKDPEFRDEEPAPKGMAIGEYNPGVTNPHDQWKQERLVSYWPALEEYAGDLVSVLDEEKYAGRNIRFVFEDWMSALGNDDKLDNLRPDRATVFNFKMLLNTNRENWTAGNFRKLIYDYYSRLPEGAAPNQVSGNHDVDALRTRLGSAAAARAAYLMLATLPGALYTWQGDVMGRPNAIMPKELQKDGDVGQRDGERIPMQWNDEENSGFSQAENLWLPQVDKKYYQRDNLELQAMDESSPYRFVREILKRRRTDPALREGKLRMLQTDNPNVLAFARLDPEDPRRQVIIVTNFSANTEAVRILDAQQANGRVTFSSLRGQQPGDKVINLETPTIVPPDASYLIDPVT